MQGDGRLSDPATNWSSEFLEQDDDPDLWHVALDHILTEFEQRRNVVGRGGTQLSLAAAIPCAADHGRRIRLAYGVRQRRSRLQPLGARSVRLVGRSGMDGKHIGTDQMKIDTAFAPGDDSVKDETTSARRHSYKMAHANGERDRLVCVM
jgi:hypothetical protein